MSNPGDADLTPITGPRALADYLAEGCKPASAFRIGTEHEKFGFTPHDLQPPAYEPNGIRAVLEGLTRFDWSPINDQGRPIGLKGQNRWTGASVSLEPAGQLELSGGPVATLHETRAEFSAHFAEVAEVARPLGLGFAPLGFHPTMPRAQMPWMPKSRYAIMRRYMPLKGQRGLDMMLRTCTVQVNLDFASEADMVKKLRVSMALQPLATALFANSPFYEGKPNGLLSNRAQVWTDVDADRTGMLPLVFEDGFGFERYVAWLLDVPMYFVQRDGSFIDVAGASFRAFMAGRLPALDGIAATVGDFADHVTTAFTDVRLKRFLEMRGADAGSPAMMLAQSAFWVGLLYDDAALDAAYALVRERPWTDYIALRPLVPRSGINTPWRGGTLRDLARSAVSIAQDGLRARDRRDAAGVSEAAYLEPLADIAAGAPTQAEHWLDRYANAWANDASRIFTEAKV
jgi:glutamate--cysteine ligase